MAFTNNWLKSQRRVDPRATHLAPPDPAHGQEATDQYPQENQAPAGPVWEGTEFARPIVQTPGLPLDAPQETGHDSRGASGAYVDQAARQAAQSRGHEGQDRGWMRATYKEPPFQDDTTQYEEACWTGNGTFSPTPEAIQRGINSLPQNNPDIEGYDPGGYRRGLRYFRFVDRKNKIDPRVYTAQQLLARGIRIPNPKPAQDGTGILKTSPFASMSRALDSISQTPALFRSPPRLTDTILADDAGSPDDGGIAVDGMWGV